MGKETKTQTKAKTKTTAKKASVEEQDVAKTKDELKEEIRKELKEEQLREEIEEFEDRRQKRRVGRVITNIILIALFLFVLFETVMGILDMQRINDDKDPLWYIDSKTETTEKKTETTYNLGLYKIVRTDDSKATKITLKPFFLK